MLERLFSLKQHGTNVRTELLAGLTSFLTMAYILAVNPAILSQCGMDASSVFTATALSAAVATGIMALLANLPMGLAPGMGLNAFFAFSVVIGMGHTWQFALTAVFIEGLIFIVLTLTNVREALLKTIPPYMRHAISAGIGLFIAFIGLHGIGLIANDDATLVRMGSIPLPELLLFVFCIAFIGALLYYKVRGALFFGILATTLIGIPLGITDLSNFSTAQFFAVPSVAPTFLQFEWHNIFTLEMALIVVTFLFVDIFDTVGTLIGLGAKTGLLEGEENSKKIKPAFMADALGTTLGAALGTSTITVYVESASGITEGGRTGLTAMTIAVLFLVSLFLAPLFLIIPVQATAPILVFVGCFMMSSISEIDFNDYTIAVPAFFTLIMMPLTYSIASGILWGVISHVLLCLFTKRTKDLTPLSYILAALFLWKLISEAM